jgi:hypothetical protein
MNVGWEEFFELACQASEPCLFFALEPHCAALNGHNISVRVESDRLIAEVVGPGFDASDLQRGHSLPHEIYLVEKADDYHSRPIKVREASPAEYRESVEVRREKVLVKYKGKGHYFEPSGRSVDLSWSPPWTYAPVPLRKLMTVLNHIHRVTPAVEKEFRLPCVVASSFVDGGELLVFWDIYSGETLQPFQGAARKSGAG